jgi:hypothetical protein
MEEAKDAATERLLRTVNTRYNVTALASLGIRCNEISVIAN